MAQVALWLLWAPLSRAENLPLEPLPHQAHITLHKAPLDDTWEGFARFTWPALGDHLDLSFWPNRFASASHANSREQLEAWATGFSGEDRDTLTRNASLVTTEIQATPDAPCHLAHSEILALPRSSVSGVWSLQNTLLHIPFFKGREDLCHHLLISFRFVAVQGPGNFSLHRNGSSYFSGPIWPHPKDALFDFQLDLSKSRLGIVGQKSPHPFFQFRGDPPPLQSPLPLESPTARVQTVGPSLLFEGPQAESYAEDLQGESAQLLAEVLDATPLPILEKLRDETIVISTQILEDLLVMRQGTTLQLGRRFGQVTPLAKSWHKAAWARQLLGAVALRLQEIQSPPRTLDEALRQETTARLMAHGAVRRHYDSLMSVRDVSQRFAFIPFFRGILEGKSLMNNAVFVGKEESGTEVDTDSRGEIWEFPSAESMEERLMACQLWPLETKDSPLLWVDWPQKIRSLALNPSASCPWVSNPLFWRIRPLSQSWAWRPLANGKGLALAPSPHSEASPSPFRLPQEEWRDPLVVKLDADAAPIAPPPPQVPPLVFLGASSGEVLPPLEGQGEEGIWPHRVRFTLTSFRFAWTSRTGDFSLDQGLHWEELGTPTGWDVLINAHIEGHQQSHLEGIFGRTIPLTFWKIPLGLGVLLKSPQPHAWAVAQGGLESLTASLLAPEGWQLSARTEWALDTQRGNWSMTTHGFAALPIATLSTLHVSGDAIRSSSPQVLDGPPWFTAPSENALLTQYGLHTRIELRPVVFHHLSLSFGDSYILEHIVARVGAEGVLDTGGGAHLVRHAPSAWAAIWGVNVYGALFGARNQLLSFTWTRRLDSPLGGAFSFSVGRD